MLCWWGTARSQAQPTHSPERSGSVRSVVLIDAPRAHPPAPRARPIRPLSTSTDRWWAPDKAKHVAFSFLWTLGTQYVLVDKAGWSNQRAAPWSAGSGAAVGVTKEVYDRHTAGRFSLRDLAADAVGIALALGVIAL